jgi:hypothetical protein
MTVPTLKDYCEGVTKCSVFICSSSGLFEYWSPLIIQALFIQMMFEFSLSISLFYYYARKDHFLISLLIIAVLVPVAYGTDRERNCITDEGTLAGGFIKTFCLEHNRGTRVQFLVEARYFSLASFST